MSTTAATEPLLAAITTLRLVRDGAAAAGHTAMASELNYAIQDVKRGFELIAGRPAPGRTAAFRAMQTADGRD